MANASQCLEEGAGQWPPQPAGPYSEAQRLALEELVAGGPEALRAFLRRERLPPFLSEPEVQAIARGAVPPNAAEEAAAEASLDASSLTYFPERSDAEPPALELGWPGFGSGAFRGLTRVEAHFQPGGGDSPYGCKEAVRRQIRSARQVIALVMDSFTDIDIFSDLQNAYSKRLVPVYILLDQDFLPYFLEMCKNLGVLFNFRRSKVRTLTGNIYYTRSGAKIIGKVHEKFMLIDGIRVTTGSYRQLNSSNLLLLSGQVVEHFDLQFRILYAQSNPINPECRSSCRNSGIFDHLEKRIESSKEYTVEGAIKALYRRYIGAARPPWPWPTRRSAWRRAPGNGRRSRPGRTARRSGWRWRSWWRAAPRRCGPSCGGSGCRPSCRSPRCRPSRGAPCRPTRPRRRRPRRRWTRRRSPTSPSARTRSRRRWSWAGRASAAARSAG
uniref:Family with sequence similarity 83 member D n=1 Tax=Coturnix japonica TaxID=93934 RepID=A0A8C2UFE7_COTJA